MFFNFFFDRIAVAQPLRARAAVRIPPAPPNPQFELAQLDLFLFPAQRLKKGFFPHRLTPVLRPPLLDQLHRGNSPRKPSTLGS